MTKWFTARVRGQSMIPALREGDVLLVRGGEVAPFGAVVVATLGGRAVVKRVGAAPRVLQPGEVWLLSDNRATSTDSRTLGPAPRAALRGVAVARIWPPWRIGPVRTLRPF